VTAVAIGIIWAGYAMASYGIVLLKGWDIGWREWISPLHPYQWPGGSPPQAPATAVFPASATTKSAPANLA
jgi:hypothetical protein